MGLKSKKNTARAVLFIFIMVPLGFAGTHGQYRSNIPNEKTRTFVETELRTKRIIRESILIKDIFHMPQTHYRTLSCLLNANVECHRNGAIFVKQML
jgi:hypothetical protein